LCEREVHQNLELEKTTERSLRNRGDSKNSDELERFIRTSTMRREASADLRVFLILKSDDISEFEEPAALLILDLLMKVSDSSGPRLGEC
jgi:hypothetical protein